MLNSVDDCDTTAPPKGLIPAVAQRHQHVWGGGGEGGRRS